MSLLSSIDYSSTHPAGRNLASTDWSFPTLLSRISRASFKTPSASLNTEIRLPVMNPFLSCRRMSSVSEGALTALRRSLMRKGWSCIGRANLGNSFKDPAIQVQGENFSLYFFPLIFTCILFQGSKLAKQTLESQTQRENLVA